MTRSRRRGAALPNLRDDLARAADIIWWIARIQRSLLSLRDEADGVVLSVLKCFIQWATPNTASV